ncbi:MAG TPA: choice-of-anchor J domain-containing protein [Bacteroidales bacterium]|nr:choice-of-anchor J domain-containing protein [Bacteroidales bacterium]HSA43704.1 choice-of-anchor J domain-containing protein [Bacteroidales bacterium]
MRNIIATALLVLSVSLLQAQERLVLFEEFTNASCGPCAATNPSLNELLDDNVAKAVSVKYQTVWPGTDPMNAHNPTQVATRVTYYGITGVPDGVQDGLWHDHPGNYTQTTLNNRQAIPSPFLVQVQHQLSPGNDTLFCQATIKCVSPLTVTGTLVAHTAIVERNIYFASAPGSNGEKHFESVMKKMLPTDQGSTLPTSWSTGDSTVLSFSWPLANVYNPLQLSVVVFIQGNTTKEVYQAGFSYPLLSADAGIVAVTGSTLSCTSSVTPTVMLRNFSSIPLDSATIGYVISGGTPQTFVWTGNLGYYHKAAVTLPVINLPGPGLYTLKVYASLPNGNPDQVAQNDTAVSTLTYLNVPAAAPISQDFSLPDFPPLNWSLENPGNDTYKWRRASASHNGGSGSAVIDFYNITAGKEDYLNTPRTDLSNVTGNAVIEFYMAHKRYSASYSDRLQVQVSTDCGLTWATVWDKQGANLATVTGYVTSSYVPAAGDWRQEQADLSAYVGNADILIRFRALSGYGNNLYIDDVNIMAGTVGIDQALLQAELNLFPNPSTGLFNLTLTTDIQESMRITACDLIGNIVYSNTGQYRTNELVSLDLNHLPAGTYTVFVQAASASVQQKVVLIR